MPTHFRGAYTIKYAVPDLAAAKAFYTKATGVDPYFDEPFYVGFNIGGYELGLDPNAQHTGAGGTLAYWGVADIAKTMDHMKSIGAEISSPPHNVGDGIKVGSIHDPFGNVIGIIENPQFDPSKTT